MDRARWPGLRAGCVRDGGPYGGATASCRNVLRGSFSIRVPPGNRRSTARKGSIGGSSAAKFTRKPIPLGPGGPAGSRGPVDYNPQSTTPARGISDPLHTRPTGKPTAKPRNIALALSRAPLGITNRAAQIRRAGCGALAKSTISLSRSTSQTAGLRPLQARTPPPRESGCVCSIANRPRNGLGLTFQPHQKSRKARIRIAPAGYNRYPPYCKFRCRFFFDDPERASRTSRQNCYLRLTRIGFRLELRRAQIDWRISCGLSKPTSRRRIVRLVQEISGDDRSKRAPCGCPSRQVGGGAPRVRGI